MAMKLTGRLIIVLAMEVTVTIISILNNVVFHREHITYGVMIHMVTDGMEVLLSLMEIDIAIILQMDMKFRSQLIYQKLMVNISKVAFHQLSIPLTKLLTFSFFFAFFAF